jgi:tryptophan-rich sensory protein
VLFLLLYLPLAGLTVLWIRAGLKLAKGYQEQPRESFLRLLGAEIAVALFIAGFAVMVVTHGRSYKVALIIVMVMSLFYFLLVKRGLYLNAPEK